MADSQPPEKAEDGDRSDPPAKDEAQIAAWIAAGDYRQAAAMLRHHGELLRAQELFEQGHHFENASAVAKERGDRLSLLRIALAGRDLVAASELQAYFRGAPSDEQRRAAKLYQRHALFFEAAWLHETIGEPETAYTLYERAGALQPRALLERARLDEQMGDPQRAAEGYAEALRVAESALSFADRVRAQEGRGRALLACNQAEAAVLHFQMARRLVLSGEATFRGGLDDIEIGLIESLLAVGEPEIAEPIFRSYSSRHVSDGPARESVVEFMQRRSMPTAAQKSPLLLGRYRLERQLGAGSMGRVYLAHDTWKKRPLALKLLPLAGVQGSAATATYRRFCLEAKLLASLTHPNLIVTYEFQPQAGVLTMEFMERGALSEEALPMPLAQLRRVLLDVIEGLSAVHAAGILHRDIKPQNLFLSSTGAAKLGDFGAASLRELGITQTEGLIGTLAYMSPEQIRGDRLTFATDVYGLGVTAFELGTGRLPFPGPDFIEQHLSAPPLDARAVRAGLPAPWAELLQRMLQKEPAARCEQLESLRATVAGLPIPRLPDDRSSGVELVAEVIASPLAAMNPPTPTSRTAHSEIFLATDARLGRPMLIERFGPTALQGEAGVAQLNWWRGMVRVAGPGLQRLLRIDLQNAAGPHIYYEATSGAPMTAITADEKVQLLRLLGRLHAAGLVHGAVAGSLFREESGPFLLLSGNGPLTWSAIPQAADDLAALERLAGPSI